MGDLRGDPARPADSGMMMRHRPGLDGLRGLAVVAVLAYHLDLPHTPGGFLEVSMFFALSGYLNTALVLVEVTAHGHVDWYRFAGARFRRLLPALIVCVLVAVVAFQRGCPWRAARSALKILVGRPTDAGAL